MNNGVIWALVGVILFVILLYLLIRILSGGAVLT